MEYLYTHSVSALAACASLNTRQRAPAIGVSRVVAKFQGGRLRRKPAAQSASIGTCLSRRKHVQVNSRFVSSWGALPPAQLLSAELVWALRGMPLASSTHRPCKHRRGDVVCWFRVPSYDYTTRSNAAASRDASRSDSIDAKTSATGEVRGFCALVLLYCRVLWYYAVRQ